MEDNRPTSPLFESTSHLLEAAAREIERATAPLTVAKALLGSAGQDEYPFYEDGYFDPEPADAWKRDGAYALSGLIQRISDILEMSEKLRDAEAFFREAHKDAVERARRRAESEGEDLPF